MQNTHPHLTKAVIILIPSLLMLWLSESFSPATLFESQSTGWVLWVSYARNLVLPFVLYLFLCLAEKWIKTWQWRALVAFVVPTLIEIGQALYYRFSPSRYVGSFDLMDILMHAIAVGLAVLVEQKVLAKLLELGNNEGSFATH